MRTLFCVFFLLFGDFTFGSLRIDFPETVDSIYATMSALALLPSNKTSYEDVKIKTIEGKKIEIRVFKAQKTPSQKYMILITGLGGSGKGVHSNYMGDLYAKYGYNCIVIPNAFSLRFINKISKDGKVGSSSRDALAVLDLLQEIKVQMNLKDVEFSISGLSHGALMASYVAYLAHRKGPLPQFKKVLLVNPPVSIEKAVEKIKEMAELKNSGILYTLNLLKYKWALLQNDANTFTEKSYSKLIADLHNISKVEIAAILGNELLRHIKQTKISSLDHVANEDLYSLESYFRSNNQVFVIHTKDDFLLDPAGKRYLSSVLGRRFYLFPRGGHMGYLWTNAFKNSVQKILGL